MTPNQIPVEVPHVPEIPGPTETRTMEPKKKKYAKEAWPGKKPIPTLWYNNIRKHIFVK